jgi:hypothetical protein
MSCEPFKQIENVLCGEAGEGTLWLSAFIFNALDSGDRLGAPNFPPHGLGEFDDLKVTTFLHFLLMFSGTVRLSIYYCAQCLRKEMQ